MDKRTDSWNYQEIHKYSSLTSENKELFAVYNWIDLERCSLVDMHFELELGIVIEGKLKRQYDNSEVILEPGEVWFTNVWEPHGYTLVDDEPCKVLIFFIHPHLVNEISIGRDLDVHWFAPFLASPESRPDKLPQKVRDEILRSTEPIEGTEIRQGCRSHEGVLPIKDKMSQLRLRMVLLQVLTAIHGSWCDQGEAPNYLSRYSLISPAIDALYSSREFITNEEAADRCGLGLSAFKKQFKELMGESFSQFSAQYRVKGVASQLTHSDDPLKKIVADWGFTDESHLHRIFVKSFQTTPGKYRQEHRRVHNH